MRTNCATCFKEPPTHNILAKKIKLTGRTTKINVKKQYAYTHMPQSKMRAELHLVNFDFAHNDCIVLIILPKNYIHV